MSWLFKSSVSASYKDTAHLSTYISYTPFLAQSSLADQLYEATDKGNLSKVKKLLENATSEDVNGQETRIVQINLPILVVS